MADLPRASEEEGVVTVEDVGLVAAVVDGLAAVDGVAAVTLGGSRARGLADASSDYDFGVYYEPSRRPPFDRLRTAVESIANLDDMVLAGGYGEWGVWINGGFLVRVRGHRADVLLRDVERVRDVLRRCAAGDVDCVYQPGHPHGFVSSIYAAEVAHARVLHDPDGTIAALRALVDPYPDALAATLTRTFGWEAEFSLGTAATAAARGDVAYVLGCAFRAVSCLVQVLFAVNRTYLMNEKGGVRAVEALPRVPNDFATRVEAALGSCAADPRSLAACLDALRTLHHETSALAAATL